MNILSNITSFYNKRRQDCLLLTEDGRLLDIRLHVEKGYVVEHKTDEAWGLPPEARIPDNISGKPLLVITERDAGPLCFTEGKPQDHFCKKIKNLISKIAQEEASSARAKVQKKAATNKLMETMQIMVIVLGIIIGILAILTKYMSGGTGGGSIFS